MVDLPRSSVIQNDPGRAFRYPIEVTKAWHSWVILVTVEKSAGGGAKFGGERI